MVYSEREREFTFAKNQRDICEQASTSDRLMGVTVRQTCTDIG